MAFSLYIHGLPSEEKLKRKTQVIENAVFVTFFLGGGNQNAYARKRCLSQGWRASMELASATPTVAAAGRAGKST